MPFLPANFLIKIKELNKKHLSASDAKVAVLGLTFKENCPDYRNSRSKHLIEELKEYGCTVYGVDPWLDDKIISNMGAEPIDLEIALKGFLDALIITVPHNEFKKITSDSAPIIIDIKGTIIK